MASSAAATASPAVPVIRTDNAGITQLMLNDPDKYNTLSREVIDDMLTHLDNIAADESVRVVVIAARGKAFCSGHNLKQMHANHDRAYYEALLTDCSRMMQSIVALPQPVIARVQGIATAAGCQLVASCDLAIAAASAAFATNGINNGLFCRYRRARGQARRPVAVCAASRQGLVQSPVARTARPRVSRRVERPGLQSPRR